MDRAIVDLLEELGAAEGTTLRGQKVAVGDAGVVEVVPVLDQLLDLVVAELLYH